MATGTDEIKATGSPILSSRLSNPLEHTAQVTAAGNYTVAGIFAIITTLCFVVLLVLQWLDWDVIAYA